MNYVTLWQIRAELGIGANDTGDDALLVRHARAAQGWIERQCGGRHFDPRRETRHYSNGEQMILLDDDLLAAITLTNGDATTIASTEYDFEPAHGYPKWALTLLDTSEVSWLPNAAGSYRRAAALDGLWGYHTRYAEAWADTLDTVGNNPLTSGGTSLTVTDADGVAADSSEPRLQAGNLIRFGSSESGEMALVVSVTYSGGGANTAVIARGQNGSTAAQQAQGTKIYVWRPDESVRMALLRILKFTYRGKDGRPTERISVLGNTQQVVPGGIPADVLDYLPLPLQVRG